MPTREGRKIAAQDTSHFVVTIARALRDWNLLYFRRVRVYRCDSLDDVSEAPPADFEVVEASEEDVRRIASLEGSSPAEWFNRQRLGHTCILARSRSLDLGYVWITRGRHYMEEVKHVVNVSHDPAGAYLHDAYVIPEARRRGVLRALVVGAKAWARVRGLSTLYMAVALDNKISRRAFESFGFTTVAGQVRLLRVRNHDWKRVTRPVGVVDVLQ
jgi:GNAT superfamily N-acetyltransferase